jgi:branched-chain amino acid transport system ATP-binding protein
MSEEKCLLQVENLNVYYGSIHAIKGISFHVNEGEIVTLIGANGAGKSTTLNTIAGLLKPKSGTVTFDGKMISGFPANRIVPLGMALCPEGRRIFQQMTVRENLEMGAYSRPRGEIEDSIEEMFQRFPRLKERRRQIAGTLSGGEQQMLAMSRALMSKPKVLMLDEPSMGLAPILVDQIFQIIQELHASGTTILLVEQNARKALQIANRAYVLETGAITLSGTGAELANSPDVKKAYLGG